MSYEDRNSTQDHRIALDARDWIVRLNSGDVSRDEVERFKAWQRQSPRHQQAFERERCFWQELGHLEIAPALAPALPARGHTGIGRRRFIIGGGAVAATAVAVVAAPKLKLWFEADFATAVGEQAEFTLPDGSTAALNTDSAIAVDFSQNRRLVRLLKGEAEFHVKSTAAASQFRVSSLSGNSDCQDGTFSVRALDGVTTVTVGKGRALVFCPSADDVLANPQSASVDVLASQQTSYSDDQPPTEPRAIDTDAEFAWRSGKIIIEGRPFAKAVAEVGRYISEPIVLAPTVDSRLPVSAIISTREPLPALRALARTQDLTTRRIPGVAIFIS